MPTQTWPASLPDHLHVGATITPRPVVERVVSDAGVVRMRRRIAGDAGHTIQGQQLLDRTQLGTLIEFYSQTCRSGVDPFTGLRHPRTDDATAVLGFAAPPVEYHLNRRQVQVTLVLETR